MKNSFRQRRSGDLYWQIFLRDIFSFLRLIIVVGSTSLPPAVALRTACPPTLELSLWKNVASDPQAWAEKKVKTSSMKRFDIFHLAKKFTTVNFTVKVRRARDLFQFSRLSRRQSWGLLTVKEMFACRAWKRELVTIERGCSNRKEIDDDDE